MSLKNTLIEYAVKNAVDHPLFTTVRCNSAHEDHNPIFRCEVKFLGLTVSDTGSSKKHAEFNACTKFLENTNLENKEQDVNQWIISKDQLFKIASMSSVVYMVDGDNLQNIPNTFQGAEVCFIFVSNNAGVLNRFRKLKKSTNVWIHVCPVTGRDACDHYLTFILGGLHVLYPKIKYIVESQDHFKDCVQEFVSTHSRDLH